MQPHKIIYYSDELRDDFANTKGAKPIKVTADYKFLKKGPLWRLGSFILYRFIATPLVYLFCRLFYGVRIENRRALQKIKGGFFLYGNHTQHVCDAFIPTLVTFPKRAYIVTSTDAVAIPVVKILVRMLGGIPLPTERKGMIPFFGATKSLAEHHSVVMIYPEAHIWPYYTKIRPFGDGAFLYPVKTGHPAAAFTVTYRERKIFKNRHPLITVRVSEPFYPDTSLPANKARRKLRDEVYDFMVRSASCDQPEYYKYIKTENKADADDPDS